MMNKICYYSGGESKDEFWKMVHLSTNILPKNKPRYLMGVGFAMDLVVCCALGVDMFDCVFPTRTAVNITAIFLACKTNTTILEIWLCIDNDRTNEFEIKNLQKRLQPN